MSDHLMGPRGRLAWVRMAGAEPTVVFVHGFKSDMTGTKALVLEAHCRARARAFVRFDCSGHGASDGRFEDGTIGAWADDVRAVIDAIGGPVVLVGSSMGGWLSLLAARDRPALVQALVLIAPAPDFTRWGMRDAYSAEQLAQLRRDGFLDLPSAYATAPTRITLRLMEEGLEHSLMHAPIPFAGPVRILHGQQDPDVPWRLSLELADRLTSTDVRLHLIKAGDHRLSTPADLALLCTTVDEVLARLSGSA